MANTAILDGAVKEVKCLPFVVGGAKSADSLKVAVVKEFFLGR